MRWNQAMMRMTFLLGLVLVSACGQDPLGTSPPDEPLAVGRLEVVDGGAIQVEIAESAEARAYGLKGRSELADGRGMAFIYTEPRTGSFTMEDTKISLRIAFWDINGRVVAILNMTPCVDDPCPSYDPGLTYIGAVEASPATLHEAGLVEGSEVQLIGSGA